MKTIGIIGGMSWESTMTYYRVINETVKNRLGGFHCAKILLNSVDFDQYERLMRAGDWESIGTELADAAKILACAGADFFLIATNTMHKVAETVEAAVNIPLLHIVDPAAESVRKQNINKVGLLGTLTTMEDNFFCSRLKDKHHLELVVPDREDRLAMHRIIFDELCLGKLLDQSRERVKAIIQKLANSGTEGVILGCTEIALLIGPGDAPVPLFDTTELHARKAVEWAVLE